MTGDADRSTDGAVRGRSSFRRSLLTSVGSVVVIYTVGLIVVGGEDALAAFREASPLRLLGAMLLQAVVVLAWPLMHRSCLRAAGEDLTYPKVLQVYARVGVEHEPPAITWGTGVALPTTW